MKCAILQILSMVVLTLIIPVTISITYAQDRSDVINVTPLQLIRRVQELNYSAVIKHSNSYVPIKRCTDIAKLIDKAINRRFTISDVLGVNDKSDTLTCILHTNDTVVTFNVIKI